MKISGLLMVLLFVSALSNALYAAKAEKVGEQGSSPESDCDYTIMTETL